MAWPSGQVPESILLASDDDHKIMISAENLIPNGWKKGTHISLPRYRGLTYLAITNHGLYSGTLDLPWHESASYRVFAHSSCCFAIEQWGYLGYTFTFQDERMVESFVEICQRQQLKALSSGTEDNSYHKK
jgi:hypothetical protein